MISILEIVAEVPLTVTANHHADEEGWITIEALDPPGAGAEVGDEGGLLVGADVGAVVGEEDGLLVGADVGALVAVPEEEEEGGAE